MMVFKVFTSGYPDQLEKQVNAFLSENRNTTVVNFSVMKDDHNYVMYAFFNVFPELPQMPMTAGVIPQQPTEIISDDPWKGEFFPVGDPPRRTNIMDKFCS